MFISNVDFYIFRFSDVQFSKNPEKYVKYKPTEVNAMLNSFFDDTI